MGVKTFYSSATTEHLEKGTFTHSDKAITKLSFNYFKSFFMKCYTLYLTIYTTFPPRENNS